MKYETTDKHPQIKEGVIFTRGEAGLRSPKGLIILSLHQMDNFLSSGYIKEVEEKEFTKSDVIDAINFSCNRTDLILTSEGLFKEWKKQR